MEYVYAVKCTVTGCLIFLPFYFPPYSVNPAFSMAVSINFRMNDGQKDYRPPFLFRHDAFFLPVYFSLCAWK
jgi:hypothetical protein